jgi:hypothetical protein
MPLQAVNASLLIEIPQFGASTTTTITTAVPNPPGHTCSSSTVACDDYSVLVPAANPSVGAFNPAGTTYTQAPAPVNYIVDGQAVNSSGGAECDPLEEQTSQQANPPGGSLTVTAGGTVTASMLTFAGCR